MKTIILICGNDNDFHGALNKVLREVHSHECDSEAVSNEQVAEMFTFVIHKLSNMEKTMTDTLDKVKALENKVDGLETTLEDVGVKIQKLRDTIAGAGDAATKLAAVDAELDTLGTKIDKAVATGTTDDTDPAAAV